jgi:hypothetical protein
LTSEARAANVRRRFDPEDLDLERPGVVHADLQLGVLRGEGAGRFLLPDFDVDYGLLPNVEFGIDGAWAIEGTNERVFSLDHPAPDNLWFSSKLGLFDVRDDPGGQGHVGRSGFAGGLQLGPRVPVAPDAHGTGFQALALLGRVQGPLRVVVNVGALVEPGDAPTHDRPVAFLAGADLSVDLDESSEWSVVADVSLVAFSSREKSQLSTTSGIVWSCLPWLDLSVNGLVGVLSGGDRYGVLLGVSPQFSPL